MHQTNHRGHNETLTATTQNQLAYKACRRWREVSAVLAQLFRRTEEPECAVRQLR